MLDLNKPKKPPVFFFFLPLLEDPELLDELLDELFEELLDDLELGTFRLTPTGLAEASTVGKSPETPIAPFSRYSESKNRHRN